MVALLVLALAPATAAAAAAGPNVPTFVSVCSFSHRSNDDPIVYPRRPGFSHDHTFVGNASTDAFSTLRSLRRAGTTCMPRGDTAAYWAPTLFANGSPVTPSGAAIYYRRLTAAPVRAFPEGLRMVAGDSRAYRPQSRRVTYWDCAVLKENFYGPRRLQSAAASGTIPRCSKYANLQLHVNFPDCWNGRTLDSPDHKRHMAYSVAGRCPASHPVAVPALSVVYAYVAPPPGTLILSSGGQFSGHADFVNSWNERALSQLVRSCLNSGAYCREPG